VEVQNLRPLAEMSVDCTGLDCRYNSGGSRDPDGSVVGYRWTFGDATGATEASGTHRYEAVVAYTLTLEVTDDLGAVGTASRSVGLIGLQATVTKIRGGPGVELTRTGETWPNLFLYRNGTMIMTMTGSSFTDVLPRGTRGTVVYQVCAEGVPICSAVVAVVV
jgi:hypothetical protein